MKKEQTEDSIRQNKQRMLSLRERLAFFNENYNETLSRRFFADIIFRRLY